VFGGEDVGSVGGATLSTVLAHVDAQGTQEHARKEKQGALTSTVR